MKQKNQPWPPPSVRLVAEGTRVIVLTGTTPHCAGIISELRIQKNFKPYVVHCDDGRVVYASGHDLAREDDPGASPLAIRPPDKD